MTTANTHKTYKMKRLCWVKGQNQFCKSKGQYKDLDGTLKMRRFYLGRDEPTANIKAAKIDAKWEELKAKGIKYWTQHALNELEADGVIRQSKVKLRADSVSVDLPAIKKEEAVQKWLDNDGEVRPECLVEFQKYLISTLVSTDKNTAQLLTSVQQLWTNDALGTLERIAKLGIAPNQMNLGISAGTKGGINVFLSDDTDPADPSKVIDVKTDGGTDGS